MSDYSYKYKARFYGTLNLDIDTRKFLKIYHKAKDQALKGKTIYFVRKEDK